MKKIYLLLITAFFLINACEQKENHYDKEIADNLNDVYRCLYINVDSAERILHQSDSLLSNATELGRNRYLLASYHVRNNKWEPLQLTDTLQKLHSFIEQHGTQSEKMRMYYLVGRCFERQGDILTALEWFQKGWDLAQQEKEYGFDYSIYSYIGSKIGFILMQEGACLLAKDYIIKSIQYVNLQSDSITAYCDKANAFFIIEKYDSAKHYADYFLELIKNQTIEESYFKPALWSVMSIYEELDDWKGAEMCIKYISPSINDCSSLFSIYLYANWLIHCGDLTEANKVLNNTSKEGTTKHRYEYTKSLFRLYHEKNNIDSIVRYANMCIQYEDSLLKETDYSQGHIVDRLYNLKKAQQKENEALKAKIKAIWMAIVTVISLIFVTMLLIFVRRKYRKITQILKKENLKKDENVAFLKKNMKMMTKNHQNLIDKTNDLMKKEQQRTLPYDYKSVLEQIKLKSLNTNNIEKEDKEKVKEICDHLYPDWESKLETLIPNVSVHHKTVCMLTLLGFNTKMMQNYTQNNKHSISYSRKYLNEKLSRENNSKEEFLKNTLESIFGPLQD